MADEQKKQTSGSGNKKKQGQKSNTSAEKQAPKRRNVPVTADWSEESVVQWGQEEGVTLFFDPNSFRELSQESVDKLDFYSAQSYWQAYNAWKEKKRQEEAQRPANYEDLKIKDPLSQAYTDKLKLRERRGWHQTWKRPDEVEAAKSVGYREIREQRKIGKKDKDGNVVESYYEENEPGYEKGPVKKIMEDQGQEELIAMEVPEELYEQHLQAVSDRVKYKKGQAVEKAEEAADRASYQLGRKGGVQVKDFSEDEGGWREVE
jgi:hypothetical protein